MTVISGYEVLTALGSGRFGNVVLVRRHSDRKLFAAKVPHSEDTAARQAAQKEAKLLMQLNHVNIVQFIELIENDMQCALVMEYASGGDLDAFLRWQQESTGYLSESAIMRIFIQIVLALQYLHEHRILHRDLKPKNILLDGDGIVKLSDFGVSKVLQSSQDSAQTITGTPHYMAPEQLEGGVYDGKTDVWSLGCVLYELATFSPPFTGSALGAVVGKILHSKPPPIPLQYSSKFLALVDKLLEKDPHRRPGLTDILAGEVVQCHMMQLVSVTTSHQPMLLEQFAERIKDHEIATLSELVSPLPNRPSCSGNGSRDHIPAPTSPKQAQPEAENARQLFFENQAAARRNKERIDEERSRAAVFLDFDDNTPRVSASESSSDYSCERQLFPVENMQPASPFTRQRSESLELSVAAVKLSPPRPRAQSSQASYEAQLEAERRRIQLETKALQERMRAMQATE